MSRGEIGGRGTNTMLTQAGLSAQDCLFLGKHCFNSGALSRSIEWFEEAWVMAGRCVANNAIRSWSPQQLLHVLLMLTLLIS